ncbi:hypothetical protein LJC23_07385 [Desulfovibrio sp. OttesenSCG-928-I05]|nr:hypothetical protein [Desulfovibrio sp. OttesenSCG-928-I05]
MKTWNASSTKPPPTGLSKADAMNTDIRLSTGFFGHPKIKKLLRKLGPDALLALLRLWLWAVQNRPDGVLSGMAQDDIEIVADWCGEEGAFVSALIELRLLDVEDGVCLLHNWEERNPWQAEAETRADKARFSRLRQVCPEEYERLKNEGINAVSKADYARMTSAKRIPGELSATAGDRPANPTATPGDTPATAGDSLAPAPFQCLTSPCLSSSPPSQPEEERETSLRSVSLSGPDGPDVQSGEHTEIVHPDLPEKKQAKKKPEPLPEDSEPYRLAVFMRDTLKANVPTLKEPDLQKWAQTFDVALRNDERMKEVRFVAQVIKWACSDSFWRANIQSPGKLREKFDQLTAKMEAEAAKARTAPQQSTWQSPAQRRLEANQQAGREAKRLLFGDQTEQEVTHEA